MNSANQVVNPGTIPSWTLRVEGRLLEVLISLFKSDFNLIIQNKKESAAGQVNAKFSSFVKSMFIELQRDPALYPEGNVIEVLFVLSNMII